MAVVLMANTKGGSGKTTAALVLAGELIAHRARVVLLEGDPNRPLTSWAEARAVPVIETSRLQARTAEDAAAVIARVCGSQRMVVIHDDHQENVFEWIEGAAAWAHFVIADPEGSANAWLTDVASQSDLVIVPFAPSALDARQVSRTIQMLDRVAKRTGRATNYRLLLTRSNAIRTRDEREIRDSLLQNGLPLMATSLRERPAYRGLFKLDAAIEELPVAAVNGLDGARQNAAEFAREVLGALKSSAMHEVAS